MLKRVRLMIVMCLVFSFVVILIPSTVFACSCAELPTVEEQLLRSKVVFSGVVLKVEERKRFNGGRARSVLFEVTETWKGIAESQVIIITGLGGGDCGINFTVGTGYLVYANHSSMYGSENDLVTIMCDRTTQLNTAQAQEDLAYLGQGEAPTIHVDLNRVTGGVGNYLWAIAIVISGVLIFFFWRAQRN